MSGFEMDPVEPDFARVAAAARRFVVMSGCSGGGKSTLLAALARRGSATAPEPGRQIVREQLFIGGDAVPWTDMDAFVRLVASRAMQQLAMAAARPGLTIFDRGLVDAYAWFRTFRGAAPSWLETAVTRFRYADTVFMAPPWPEIFVADAERRHGFAEAEAEYHGLLETYCALGYRLVELPRIDVESRADFVIANLPASLI